MVNQTKNILVLGGGIGGLRCALELERKVPRDFSIILIDKEPYHTFSPLLYEAATAFPRHGSVRRQFHEIRSAAAIPFKALLKHHRIHFFQKDVESIHPNDHTVLFTNQSIARYDYLAIALGSVTNFTHTPGISQFAFALKSLNDALNIRAQLGELFERTPRDPFLTIMIVGGGLSGVELSGELAQAVRHLCQLYGRARSSVSITLVEALPTILADLNPRLRREAFKRLKKIGVRVVTNQSVASYTNGQIIFQDNTTAEADLCVWTAGIRGNPLSESIAGAEQERGFLSVEPSLQLIGHPHHYALGDIAYITDPTHHLRASATAQKAIAQGRLVAENIARAIRDKPPVSFSPLPSRWIVPIGGKYGLIQMSHFKAAGIVAWWLKNIIHFKYLLSILPVGSALRHWIQSAWLTAQND